jgi:hypothetical protein
MGMAIFSTIRSDEERYRKFVMVDEYHLRHRSFSAAQGPHRLWSSRDVQLLFSQLEVDESFLLTHRQRETLFHKPPHGTDVRGALLPDRHEPAAGTESTPDA